MKKTAGFVLVWTLLASSVLPAFGQNPVCFYRTKRTTPAAGRSSSNISKTVAPKARKRTVAPAADYASFEKVTATNTPNGNLIEWQMISEKGNLGFYVYRSGKDGKQRISESMTIGSSSLAGPETLYGQTYQAVDPDGGPNDSYFVVAVGPFGERNVTDEVPATAGDRTAGQELFAAERNAGITVSTKPTYSAGAGPEGLSSDLNTHRWVVSNPGAKIAVRIEGLYRVRLAELQAASNVFTSGNTANWRLFREGVEQAVLIGSDANGPYVEFYGRPVDTRESDTRIYYLIVDPAVQGLRMSRQKTTDVGGSLSPSYPAVIEKKERTTYIGNIFNGNAENWWGRPIDESGTTMSLSLTGVDFSEPTCVVNVYLHGWSFTGTLPSVRVALNGNTLGNITAPGSQIPFSGQFTVPTSLLQEGANSVTYTSNVSSNTELFSRITVSYARRYQSSQNRLSFEFPTKRKADVTGFSSSSIRVFNISNEDRPAQIRNVTAEQAPDLSYTAHLPSLSLRGGRAAFVVADTGILTSPSVTTNRPSNMSSTVREADLIIIHHSAPDFEAAAQAWGAYRQSHDAPLSVSVVDVADIFDEFSYGSSSSFAIRDFLQYVNSNWTTHVQDKRYVLLIGDSNVDARNYKGFGSYNQVPTLIVTTGYAETASDESLGDVNGDGLAEMSIGRIPFRTIGGVNEAFNKTVAFETPANGLQNINRGAFFAYDAPIGYEFGPMSVDLAGYLPASVPKTFVGRDDPDSHNALFAQLNSGPYLVNFNGHGAQSFWGADTFLSYNTVNSELANGPNLSIYTMLTCLTGYFIGWSTLPGDECISERLLKKSNGGSPAAWASSGLTTADLQMVMGKRFMSQIGQGNITRMGDLVRDAKSVIGEGTDVRLSWVLFGDPMLKVR